MRIVNHLIVQACFITKISKSKAVANIGDIFSLYLQHPKLINILFSVCEQYKKKGLSVSKPEIVAAVKRVSSTFARAGGLEKPESDSLIQRPEKVERHK